MSRPDLLRTLSRQQVWIPDLHPIFESWPQGINENYRQLIPVVDRKLQSLIPSNPTLLTNLQRADFALFASTWHPTASFPQLIIFAYLAIWLFLWDDELDDDNGKYTTDLHASQIYRRHTISWIEQTLGIQHHGLQAEHLHPNIASFEAVGSALRDVCSVDQRDVFSEEMMMFMDASEREQRAKIEGRVWSVEEYRGLRVGTSAVGVCTATIEYMQQTSLPPSLRNLASFRTIWLKTTNIIWLINDLLSLKKELRAKTVDSLIPLLHASGIPLQEAINTAVQDVKNSVARFDAAAATLIAEVSGRSVRSTSSEGSENGKMLVNAVKGFVEIARQNCTGNLKWSLVTQRYGLAGAVRGGKKGILIEL